MRHTHRLLVQHISAIRRINIFSHTKCVLILESNLAFESQHLLHALENAGVKNWVSLSEGQQGSLGWLTTHERKEQMCLLLREAMNVGRIGLSPFFFSTELQPREAKQRIKDELSSFCVVNEAPKTTFGKFRKTYTGKLYGTSVAPESRPLASKCTRAKRKPPHHPNPNHRTQASRTTCALRFSWQ